MSESDTSPIQAHDGHLELYQDYQALRDDAGLVSLQDHGVFSVAGPDRVEWLHNLTTVDVRALMQGSGAYGLVLNGSAHVIADFHILTVPESFLLYTNKHASDKLYARLRRSIFRERVAVARDHEHTVLSLQGSRSRQILEQALRRLLNLEPFQHIISDSVFCVRNPRTDRDGYDLLVPHGQLQSTVDLLTRHGARLVSPDALNMARIEAGVPWFGDDFDETMLALEARLDAAIAENKGCYPGQEVIARIHNRGHVNRLLVQLLCNGDVVPRRGDPIFSGDNEVGWITSPSWSYAHDRPLALGYTRRPWSEKGTDVQIARDPIRIQAQVIGP